MKNLNKATVILLFVASIFTNVLSCNNQKEDSKASLKEQHQNRRPRVTHISSFVPLTYEKIQAIRNGSDLFSMIHIQYNTKTDVRRNSLYLSFGGVSGTGCYFNSLDTLFGNLDVDLYTTTPPVYNGYSKDFSVNDLNEILDYLDEHHDYFFNAAEYNGLNLPVQSENSLICDDNYVFGLAIYQPDSSLYGSSMNAWGIHKCVHDPPVPDSPLYGLFQLLETNFVNKFDQ